MPAIIVGTARIATQAEILRMSSFWRMPTWATLALSALSRRASTPASRSAMRRTWSCTSRKYGSARPSNKSSSVPDDSDANGSSSGSTARRKSSTSRLSLKMRSAWAECGPLNTATSIWSMSSSRPRITTS